MMDFTPSPHLTFSEAFQAVMDAAIQAERAKDKPRTYLGGSRLGVECERALAYEYHHVDKDPDKGFKGKTLRVFDRGHDNEERMASYLRFAGFTLLTENASGKQFGFYTARDPETGTPRIAGHLDGVITVIPPAILADPALDGLKAPCLWENKCLSDKSWKETVKKAVKVSKPVYYAQMQTYQAYLDLTENPGLFTCQNADTGEIYAELIQFDPKVAQDATDRGARVVQTRTPEEAPRIAREATDFRCKWCDYSERCWDAPIAEPAAPQAWAGAFGQP